MRGANLQSKIAILYHNLRNKMGKLDGVFNADSADKASLGIKDFCVFFEFVLYSKGRKILLAKSHMGMGVNEKNGHLTVRSFSVIFIFSLVWAL